MQLFPKLRLKSCDLAFLLLLPAFASFPIWVWFLDITSSQQTVVLQNNTQRDLLKLNRLARIPNVAANIQRCQQTVAIISTILQCCISIRLYTGQRPILERWVRTSACQSSSCWSIHAA
jgi:hypothetical protein